MMNASYPTRAVLTCLLTIFLSGVQQAVAEEIYKVTRKDGTVYYSNIPPDEGAESSLLDSIPEPSETDRLAAEQRLREIQERVKQRRAEREEQKQEQEQEEAAEDDEEDTQGPSPISNPFPGLAPFL